MTLWWCSFCDPGRPEGQQFLGVSIVPGPEPCLMSHLLNCNPGGEMLFDFIPEGRAATIPEGMIGRLLNRQEAEVLMAKLDQGIN